MGEIEFQGGAQSVFEQASELGEQAGEHMCKMTEQADKRMDEIDVQGGAQNALTQAPPSIVSLLHVVTHTICTMKQETSTPQRAISMRLLSLPSSIHILYFFIKTQRGAPTPDGSIMRPLAY